MRFRTELLRHSDKRLLGEQEFTRIPRFLGIFPVPILARSGYVELRIVPSQVLLYPSADMKRRFLLPPVRKEDSFPICVEQGQLIESEAKAKKCLHVLPGQKPRQDVKDKESGSPAGRFSSTAAELALLLRADDDLRAQIRSFLQHAGFLNRHSRAEQPLFV